MPYQGEPVESVLNMSPQSEMLILFVYIFSIYQKKANHSKNKKASNISVYDVP